MHSRGEGVTIHRYTNLLPLPEEGEARSCQIAVCQSLSGS